MSLHNYFNFFSFSKCINSVVYLQPSQINAQYLLFTIYLLIEQQSNRMQFLQPQYVVPQQPQQYCQQPIVLKTEELRPIIQQHHQYREKDKENLNPKSFQSGRLISQHDTPQHSQRSLQQIPVGAFQSQTSNEAQINNQEKNVKDV
ncbi:unnamed protein product [Paramecium sonneborni]|uniref:Uncharacterized protein n=1 Tax=Paramecium sonneborni TaxID=65129 RepID=A0A8S1RLT4_9CILI|nr:unnamed protein product [Paramecium sonneborni]